MPRRFDGKTAIVTGGASGFGRTTALLLAAEGARVVVADLDAERGKAVVQEVQDQGGEAVLRLGDVSEAATATALVQQARAEFGRLDILVNNAGIAQTAALGTSWDATEEQWDRIIRVNLRSVYACTRAAVPAMRASGGGSIVNVASIAATVAVGGSAYAATKGAILSYTRHVAVELAPEIRVNCVSPGYMWTPMATGERHGLPPAAQEARKAHFAALALMDRVGEAEDIAHAILFFASDDAGFVTGRELVVDGGHLVRSS